MNEQIKAIRNKATSILKTTYSNERGRVMTHNEQVFYQRSKIAQLQSQLDVCKRANQSLDAGFRVDDGYVNLTQVAIRALSRSEYSVPKSSICENCGSKINTGN